MHSKLGDILDYCFNLLILLSFTQGLILLFAGYVFSSLGKACQPMAYQLLTLCTYLSLSSKGSTLAITYLGHAG